MSNSSDDVLTIPGFVSYFYFTGSLNEPISFTQLRVIWEDVDIVSEIENKIYLRGETDFGQQKVHTQVLGWRYSLSGVLPQISALCQDNKWIEIANPRKSYMNVIRSILISIGAIHYLSRSHKASSNDLRDHLCQVCSNFETWPCVHDLSKNLEVIREAVKKNKSLQKSKFLASLLVRRTRIKGWHYDSLKKRFIDDDDDFSDTSSSRLKTARRKRF